MIRISCDLDDTIFDFKRHYNSIFGIPKRDTDISRNIWKTSKDFWLEQPVINRPNFTPHNYCTARVINKRIIKKQIEINSLPNVPIYQVFGYGLSKSSQLKRSGADVHIDDSLRVFIDLNLKGIPCLLMDSENNQEWGPIGRVYSLDKDEIEETYYLFMNTVFDNFKDLI